MFLSLLFVPDNINRSVIASIALAGILGSLLFLIVPRLPSQSWYTLIGKPLLSNLIGNLQARGHQNLFINENGEILIQNDDSMEIKGTFEHFPPKELGAIGSQGNNYTIAEYPSKTGDLHVVIYNRTNGKFIAGIYPKPVDSEATSEQYLLKEDKNSGAALLFALLPTIMQD